MSTAQLAASSVTPVKGLGEQSTAYAWYVAAVLVLVQIISMLDRKVLVILAEPVKRDLQLSDVQMGILTGAVFSIVYAVFSFPLARLADRFSRPRIIGGCLFVWSALTAAGGFATSFLTLAVSRMGVAVGESGAAPASHSLLTSYFPPAMRGTALAVLMAGAPVGIMAGLSIGGWLNDRFDWRTALIVAGTPGVVVALLVLFTMKEVRQPQPRTENRAHSTIGTAKHFLNDKILRYMVLGVSLHFVVVGAINAFTPAFIMRRFELSAGEVGLGYGLVVGIVGFFGSILGGMIADRLNRRGHRFSMYFVAITLLVAVPIEYATYSADSYSAVLALVGVKTLLSTFYAGPTFAMLHSRVADRQRATATAILLFAINGLGASCGPVIAGLVSDWVAAGQAADWRSLRIGLLCVVPLELAGAALYILAGRYSGRISPAASPAASPA